MSQPALQPPDALELLARGRIDVEGRMAQASNATLYASVEHAGVQAHCIYKPVAGERPLWDYPHGTLSRREVAAYELSAETGWDVVPPTVWRDGPFGPGSVQLWVDTVDAFEEEEAPADVVDLVDLVDAGRVPAGWLPVLDAEDGTGRDVTLVHADDPRLQRMAVFDVVVDNADRKAGHVLPAGDGTVHGCDHGLTFNEDDKLRTVLWGWRGEPLPEECVEVLLRLQPALAEGGSLRARLDDLLAPAEVARTRFRLERLLRRGVFPSPRGGGPAIPWPPF